MKKRLLSGVVAFTMLAGMSTLVPSAAKLGDVLNNEDIAVDDVAAIINHVNGVKPLTDFQMKLADVNGDNKVDIQDAAAIINHINGVKPLEDVDITTDDEDTTNEEDENPTDGEDDDSSDIDDSSEDESSEDESSEDESSEDESSEDESSEDESSEDESSEDEETTGEETEPGSRTLKLFSDLADSNYYFSFKGNALLDSKATTIDTTINQIDADTSIVHLAMTRPSMDSIIYNIGAKKYKIVDFDKEQFTANLTDIEKMLDFNSIFVDLASNDEAIKFVGQEIDEETGYVVETYTTAISTPVVADLTVKAYYDKKTDKFEKLVLFTPDYDPEESKGLIYINTDSLEFTPSFEFKDELPDFSKWEKIKK